MVRAGLSGSARPWESSMKKIPENVRVALHVYQDHFELKAEWERRDALGDFVIDGVTFTRLELMWVFKKLIQETQT